MSKSKPEMEMPKPQQYVEERMPGGKYYDDGEAWREMPDAFHSAKQLDDDAWERWLDGIDKHGPRFLGQPTAHIREELIDALRYAEMIEKQIAWLTAENARIRASFEVNLAAQAEAVEWIELNGIDPKQCDWDHIRQPHGLGCFIKLD